MPAAAKEEMLASPNAEGSFSLAAGVAAALDTRDGANADRGEKSHQGIFSKNRRPRIGSTWLKWSGTHQDRSLAWSETMLGPTIYLYSGLSLVEELDGSGNILARYAQEPRVDGSLSMLRGQTTSYYEHDGSNSVTSLSSPAGALSNTYTYDSFGKLVSSTGSTINSLQYTGREFDSETTIYLYRARYYDPAAGRFFSEDPIRFSGGSDFYVYVSDSPIGLIDPFGLDALGGDVQALANIFPGSSLSPDGGTLTVPMSCMEVRRILQAQGYQDSNSWGYNGPGSAFWDPVYHSGGWEWRTSGPGFHFRMQYDGSNSPSNYSSGSSSDSSSGCAGQNCKLDQFHIDPHNPLEPGQTWKHVTCDFFHWCSN